MAIMITVILQLFILVASISDALSLKIGTHVEPNSGKHGNNAETITINFTAEWEHMFAAFRIERGGDLIGYLKKYTECVFIRTDQNCSVNITCQDGHLEGLLNIENIDMPDSDTTIRFTLTESTNTSEEHTYQKNITIPDSDSRDFQISTAKSENKDGGTKLSRNPETNEYKSPSKSNSKSGVTDPLSTLDVTAPPLKARGEYKVNTTVVIILTISGVAIAIVIGGIMSFIKVKMKANALSKKSKECSKENTEERWDLVDGGYKDNVLYIPFELDVQAQKFQMINQRIEAEEQDSEEEAIYRVDAVTDGDTGDVHASVGNKNAGKDAAARKATLTNEPLYSQVNKRKQAVCKVDVVTDEETCDVHAAAVARKATFTNDSLYSEVNKRKQAIYKVGTAEETNDVHLAVGNGNPGNEVFARTEANFTNEPLYSQVNKRKQAIYKVDAVTDGETGDVHTAVCNKNAGKDAVVRKATFTNEPLYSQVNKRKHAIYKVGTVTDEETDDVHFATGNENAKNEAVTWTEAGKTTVPNEPLYSEVNKLKRRNGTTTKSTLDEDHYENILKVFPILNDVPPRIPHVVSKFRTKAKPTPKPRKEKK